MDMSAYREEIKLALTGYVLDLELEDSTLDRIINKAFRETQRYMSSTRIMTLSYSRCIDLSKYKINSVINVFRAEGFEGTSSSDSPYVPTDPIQASLWQAVAGTGDISNFSNYVLNYASWSTLQQVRNTLSTDLAFRYDPYEKKLYIDASTGIPNKITVMYVPRYDDVSEVISDYWIDIICRLSIAIAKITLGRVRSKYTQSNSLWQLDGQTLLQEGNQELTELRQHLVANSMLMIPYD